MSSQQRGRSLTTPLALELLMTAALAVLLLGFHDLPLVDLPQHAWQLASWLRIDAGDPRTRYLELNFRTPYLLAYPVARAFASVLPVLVALKLTLLLSIAMQARALRLLCERLGYDPWLGLLGFPLGLGYSFCFGFVSFCAAIPLVYLAFAGALVHRRQASLRSGVALASTLALLLVAHGVAVSFTLLVISPLLLAGERALWHRAWPVLAVPLLGFAWLAGAGSETRYGADDWTFQAWRWQELPAALVGIGSADAASTLFGTCLLAVVLTSLGRVASALAVAPLLLTLVGYGFFPAMFRGVGPLWPRFATFLVPAMLVAFAPRSLAPLAGFARRAVVLGLCGAVIGTFGLRLPAYQREVAELRRLLEALPDGRDIRPLVFERSGSAFPGTPAHLHTPAYYAVERGGRAGYSFAMYSISVVRFRPGTVVRMGGGAEWAPERFDAEREADDYDYFFVRSSKNMTSDLFPGPAPGAVLEARDGRWWRYRRVP